MQMSIESLYWVEIQQMLENMEHVALRAGRNGGKNVNERGNRHLPNGNPLRKHKRILVKIKHIAQFQPSS